MEVKKGIAFGGLKMSLGGGGVLTKIRPMLHASRVFQYLCIPDPKFKPSWSFNNIFLICFIPLVINLIRSQVFKVRSTVWQDYWQEIIIDIRKNICPAI
jgi:hypothetical protein